MENKEVNILDIIKTVLHKWWIILLAGIICASGAFAYTKMCITPMYSARVTFLVNNSGANISGAVTEGELQAGKTLLQTYTVILKSRNVLEEVAKHTNGKYSYASISSMVSAGSINQTDILAVQVTSPIPEDAHLIADLIAEILPGKIFEITGRMPPSVVDYATTPQYPSSPNTLQNVITGFLFGFVIACAVIVVFDFLNDRFRKSEDITSRYSAPLLAEIPDLVDRDKRQSYYYYKYKAKEEGGKRSV